MRQQRFQYACQAACSRGLGVPEGYQAWPTDSPGWGSIPSGTQLAKRLPSTTKFSPRRSPHSAKNSHIRFPHKQSKLLNNCGKSGMQPTRMSSRAPILPFKWRGRWAVGGGDVAGGEERRPWGGAPTGALQHHACRGCLSGAFGTNAQRVSATRPTVEHRSAVRAADHRRRSRHPRPTCHATATNPAANQRPMPHGQANTLQATRTAIANKVSAWPLPARMPRSNLPPP